MPLTDEGDECYLNIIQSLVGKRNVIKSHKPGSVFLGKENDSGDCWIRITKRMDSGK